MSKEKIFIGADSAGYALKGELITYLVEAGYEVVDCGTDSDASCHYPIYAAAVSRAVLAEAGSLGILVCGTGIGMSITANKFDGIRASVCGDTFSARMTRMHNDAMFSGKFESKGAFHLHRTALRTLWFAMYIPESQIGFTAILDDDTAMAGGCRFWDRSNSHKLYYQPGFAKELQAGWKSMVYTMTIKGFTAPEASWKAAAEEQAEGGVEE